MKGNTQRLFIMVVTGALWLYYDRVEDMGEGRGDTLHHLTPAGTCGGLTVNINTHTHTHTDLAFTWAK